MPTIKQKLALKKIVENRGNVSKSMKAVGYSKNTAKNPKNLTESDGFKKLLKESGLDETLVLEALVEDIKYKPQDRIRELMLGAEILGLRKKGSDFNNQERDLPTPIIPIYQGKSTPCKKF